MKAGSITTLKTGSCRLDAVVEFTTEVADVAARLCDAGRYDECERLTAALDRLDAAGR